MKIAFSLDFFNLRGKRLIVWCDRPGECSSEKNCW